MRVILCISSTEIPLLRASKTVNRRRSSVFLRRSFTFSSEIGAALRVSRDISAPLTAFIIPSSKLLPIAITSPVAFICVPKVRGEPANLSNGHLGSLTTT